MPSLQRLPVCSLQPSVPARSRVRRTAPKARHWIPAGSIPMREVMFDAVFYRLMASGDSITSSQRLPQKGRLIP
jgi:hypothetical protein